MTTQLQARTLAEAYMYVELVVGRTAPVDLMQIAELSRADGHDVLRVDGWHAGDRYDFTIVVPSVDLPSVDLQDDIDAGTLYGEGTEPSVLIDAGQWRGVEHFCAANIAVLLEQAGGGALSPYAVNEVAKNLESACSALAEVRKFLPAGADEVPAEAFWTDTGRSLRQHHPEAFRRDRLARDDADYRAMADQLNAFYDGRPQPPLPERWLAGA